MISEKVAKGFMRTMLKAVLVPLVIFGLTSTASAGLVTVDDVYDPGNDVFLDTGSKGSYKWTHDIKDNGFNPTTDTIVGASLRLGLRDDSAGDGDERVDFKLDGDILGLHRLSLGTGYSQSTVWVDINYLQSDGSLTVKLTATKGDFYLVDSTLHTTWDHPAGSGAAITTTTVPEPGSALLLGLGLAAAGLGLIRRKSA